MKYIKTFENKDDSCWVIIEMEGNLPEHITVFKDEESKNNYIINAIHGYFKEEGEDSFDDIFDPDELVEKWNDTRLYEGEEMHVKKIEYLKNVQLRPELKIKKEAKKYNL